MSVETSPEIQATPHEQPSEETQKTTPTQKKQSIPKSVILIIFLVILGLGLAVASQVLKPFGIQEKNDSIELSTNPTQTQQIPPTAEPTSPQNLTQYKSTQLEGFTFNYDPSLWKITRTPTPDDLRLLLEHTSGDVLRFELDLGWGVGGSLTTIRENELVSLQTPTQLYRLEINKYPGEKPPEIKDSFQYGKSDNTTPHPSIFIFKDRPQEKADALKHCEEIKKGFDGMALYTIGECADIESGKILGYVARPTFDRSLQFKRLVPLSEIQPQWAADEYVKFSGIDNGNMIVNVSFQGNDPTIADEIVKQLQPLSL